MTKKISGRRIKTDLENINDALVYEINGINKKLNITLKFKPADDSQFKFSVL